MSLSLKAGRTSSASMVSPRSSTERLGVSMKTFMRQMVATVAAALALSSCAGNSSGLGVNADGDYFDGLDTEVVNEVLLDPRREGVLRDVFEDGAERESVAQAMVVSNEFCRRTYGFYQEWISTGIQPPIPEPPQPLNPAPTYTAFLEGEYAATIADIESGDPDRLRRRLAEIDGGCGQFTPVSVGDINGISISEALGGLPRAEPWGDE